MLLEKLWESNKKIVKNENKGVGVKNTKLQELKLKSRLPGGEVSRGKGVFFAFFSWSMYYFFLVHLSYLHIYLILAYPLFFVTF